MSRLGIFFSLMLALLVVAAIIPATPVPADQGGIPHASNEIIVKYKVNTTQAEKDQIRGEIHGQKMKAWGRIRSELNHLEDGMTVEEAIARLQGNPKVEYAEPNYVLTADEVPDDPMFPQLWGMQNTGQTGGTAGADIHATNAWDVFTGSDSVLVGVIDTGVDYTHPDLAANIWTNPGEIPGNGIDDDGNGFIDDIHGWDFVNNDNDPMDDAGHGSHVSGTIGAVGNNGIGVAGVNWHIRIMGLKFLDSSGSGSTDDAVDAVYYATMMGVRLTSNSWGGGGFSQTLYDAIQDAGAHNILFVAAAGNEGANMDVNPHYPGAYDLPNIVSVAATDHDDLLADFSNYGATTVDLGAPGVDILSTFPGNSYGSISGTSMATPHVSGALGLIFGRFPNIGALDAKNLLMNFADPIPSLTGKCITGARLNAFLPIAEPDSIPPGAITDLAVTGTASNWMTVAWTAPGDDGNTGTASRYDVRYSTSAITPANFASATPADNPPDPGAAGTPESMQVSGLDFSTTYYFAVKALDEFGNAGPLSNVPSGTTLGAPDIDVTPTSLTETLLTGATSLQNLTLSNLNSNTTLDFEIPLPELITNPVVVQAFVDVPKGGVDARTGDPVVDSFGGPDAFGYRWVDSDESYGPVFQWTDISGTGTAAITTGDDTNNGPFPIGFTFPFYGVDYSDFRVCSNGFVSLTSNSTAYGNQPLPNTGAPPTLIAPFWDDLDVAAGGGVYYESDGSSLIVQWNNVAHYGGGGPYSFQAILHDDGSIEYQYLSMGSPNNSATIGIQNAAQTDGFNVAFNTAYVHDNLAVRIQAVPQWMTVSPSAGTVFGPGNTTLGVTFDAGGLLGGTYDGTIHVGSNDPDENPFDIPVTLTVIGAPDIAVEPLSFDFGQVFLGATPSHTFAVRNPGTDTLHVSSVSMSDAAYTPSMTSFAVPPRSSLGLDVTFAPTLVQLYPATMTLASDDPDNPSVVVSLAGEGVEPPQFQVDPASLTSDLLTGQTENQVLTIANNGGANLDYDIAVDLGTQVTQYTSAGELPKGAADSNPGVLGSGGPDSFGYQWIDSDEVGGPLFDWTDISGVGTPVFTSTADDGNTGPFPIGFDFNFYGNTFSDFRVCSNGWISFTSSLTGYSNVALPNNGLRVPENLLAVFWDDMKVDFAQGGQVFYYNDGSKLIVQYDNVIHYGQSGGPYFTFQVQLYPNGTILYQYLTLGAIQNSVTIGIQNATKDDGLTVVYNATYVHENMAIRIASSPDWMSANPLAGTVAPGDTAHVNVRFNAEGLFGGRYEGFVNVNTNDPAAPQVEVPATLNVTGAPDIDVNPLALDFGQVFVGYPDLLTFRIANVGTDLLTVSSITSDDPDFAVDFSGVSLPLNLSPLQEALITVRYATDLGRSGRGASLHREQRRRRSHRSRGSHRRGTDRPGGRGEPGQPLRRSPDRRGGEPELRALQHRGERSHLRYALPHRLRNPGGGGRRPGSGQGRCRPAPRDPGERRAGQLRLQLEGQRRSGWTGVRLGGHLGHGHSRVLEPVRRRQPRPVPDRVRLLVLRERVQHLPGVEQRLGELHQHHHRSQQRSASQRGRAGEPAGPLLGRHGRGPGLRRRGVLRVRRIQADHPVRQRPEVQQHDSAVLHVRDPALPERVDHLPVPHPRIDLEQLHGGDPERRQGRRPERRVQRRLPARRHGHPPRDVAGLVERQPGLGDHSPRRKRDDQRALQRGRPLRRPLRGRGSGPLQRSRPRAPERGRDPGRHRGGADRVRSHHGGFRGRLRRLPRHPGPRGHQHRDRSPLGVVDDAGTRGLQRGSLDPGAGPPPEPDRPGRLLPGRKRTPEHDAHGDEQRSGFAAHGEPDRERGGPAGHDHGPGNHDRSLPPRRRADQDHDPLQHRRERPHLQHDLG